MIVLFAGAMPPPVGGQSRINEQMVAALRARCSVIVLDLSAGRLDRSSLGYHTRRLSRLLGALVRLMTNARRARRLYLSTDSGAGLIYNIVLVCAARLTGYRLFLHYHSFAFIDQRSRLMATLVLLAGSRATHVFLCDRMREQFIRQYPVAGPHLICSNAPLVPRPPEAAAQAAPPMARNKGLTIGLLSHLFREKGLHEFISLLRVTAQKELPIAGILAGPPVTEADEAVISAAQDLLGERLEFRGPVYGPSKAKFFADIDVFVFPTRFRVEAQPLVLFEALSYGIPVISFCRGCIASDLHADAATLLAPEADFEAEALATLNMWLDEPARFASAQEAAAGLGRELQEQGRSGLDRLLLALTR